MIPVFDETPEFEKQVTVAAYEAAWMKRELDTLVSSSKAASKALASRVEVQRGLLGLVAKKGPDGDPPVETFFVDELCGIGSGSEAELSSTVVAAMGVNKVTPVLDILKTLGPMRVKLGNKVYNATTRPLEAFIEFEVAAVTTERDRYSKAKASCLSARADYLGLKKTADAEAVAAMEAKRQYLLLEAVHESALAYQEFITQANAAMQALPDALQALRARATQAQEQAQQDLARSRESLDRYLAEQDKVDDTAPAEVSTGQNLGRSHDADIRRLLEAGTGVIRQGYLMKTARTWGWRRRFFVLDAQGMLTYYNEKAAVKDVEKRLAGKAPAPPSGGSPSPTAAPADAAASAAPPLTPSASAQSVSTLGDAASVADSASSDQKGVAGFGGRALNFMKKAADKLEKLSTADIAAAAAAATGGGGMPAPSRSASGDDDEEVKFQTVNLRLSAVKLDGDPNDRTSRDLRYCFRIISPTTSLVLQAESEEARAQWVAALQGVIAELITAGPKKSFAAGATAVLTAVQQGAPGNSSCADCGEADPDWASLNTGVLLCQSCAGAHRSLGTHVSKVRSVALDADSWAPPVVGLFTAFGNSLANDSWEGNRREAGAAPPLVPPGATADERLALIRNKYEARLFVSAPLAEMARGGDALREATATGDVGRVMALLAGGAKAGAEEDGKPPLVHVAAALGDTGASVAAALLLNGGDAAALNAEGQTPADVAKAAGAAEDGPLLTVLQRFAAKRI